MAQKRSESRFDKGGRILYLVYEADQRSRTGGTSVRRRARRFYLPADSKNVSIEGPHAVQKRTGRRVHGVQVRYRHMMASATARRGGTTYKVPERWSERTKVLELPRSARNVRLTDKPPAGTRVAVA